MTSTIKEYLCFKEYIEAVNVYNEWFEFFHRERPVRPVAKFDLEQAQLNQQQSGLDQTNIFAERIAFDYQLKQYEDLLGRWSSKAKIYCDKARSKFMSLLKFPFGGWIVDIVDPDADENMQGWEKTMGGASSKKTKGTFFRVIVLKSSIFSGFCEVANYTFDMYFSVFLSVILT